MDVGVDAVSELVVEAVFTDGAAFLCANTVEKNFFLISSTLGISDSRWDEE